MVKRERPRGGDTSPGGRGIVNIHKWGALPRTGDRPLTLAAPDRQAHVVQAAVSMETGSGRWGHHGGRWSSPQRDARAQGEGEGECCRGHLSDLVCTVTEGSKWRPFGRGY
ncbi:hypothetical protein chiPu_0001839 [Chiloscyllium punctatum]|uniref:Uncharacterized protein n=1 Tax=Chiloscyllium punctatum TaxID=137246 RepID=A0A401RZ65_CHIPU|nr:hypothetical protein [Chiloscyllium punctatum]